MTPEEILTDFFKSYWGIAQEKERKDRILNGIRCEYRKAFENTPAGSCLLWIEELVRMPGAELGFLRNGSVSYGLVQISVIPFRTARAGKYISQSMLQNGPGIPCL